MKRLSPLIFILLLSGCMHYAVPHEQNITLTNIEKLPVKVGLYMPATIVKGSIETYVGEDIFHTKGMPIVQSGAIMANAIKKSVSASVKYLMTFDTLPDPTKFQNDSLAFLITPEFTRKKATAWMAIDHPTSFESTLKLTFTGRNNQIIDSSIIHAFGVSNLETDSSHTIDSLVAISVDSGISSMQDQIVYNITRNTKLRSYLGLPDPTKDSSIITPASHGVYGTISRFDLDTNSYSLMPIPKARRWSGWFGMGITMEPSEIKNFSAGVDLLLQSRYSFRLSFFLLDYHKIFDWGISTQASYLFFGPRFFAEAGLGLSTIFGNGFTGIIRSGRIGRFQPFGIVGFRYQPIFGGVCLGISYTPYFDEIGLQDRISFSEGLAF